MSIITDGLLIATCLTAALYCIVLSRRLSRFSDTESGIGQQISQLNSILEETRASTKESQNGAKSVAERLARDLSGAKKASLDLTALIERTESTLDRAFELQQSSPPARKPVPNVEEPERSEQPDAAPVMETPTEPIMDSRTPIDELSHEDVAEDIAERDFDLADARGEPQLGFLPNVTDSSSMSDLSLEESEDTKTDAETAPDAGETDENLLKVERMAL